MGFTVPGVWLGVTRHAALTQPIAMFFDDHGYLHFHARHAGGEAKVPPSCVGR
jgi:hypothetical protein